MRIIKSVCILGAICLFYGILSMQGIAVDSEDVDQLFRQAVSLVDRAKVESEDYSRALEFYKKAREKVDTVLSQYASSDLSAELTSGRLDIAGYSLEEFLKMGEFLEILSAAEEDLMSCALVHAGRVYGPLESFYKIRNIAGAYSRAGLFREAMAAADNTAWRYEKGRILLLIANRQAAIGGKEEASQLVFQALELSRSVGNNYWGARLIMNIAQNYSLASEKEKKKELLLQMLESVSEMLGPDKDTVKRLWIDFALVAISSGFTELEMFDEALDAVGIIENKWQRVEAITDIAERYYELGKTVETEKLLAQAKDIINSITDNLSKIPALKTLAVSYAKTGQFYEALKTKQLLEGKNSRIWALSNIANESVKDGRREEFFQLQNEALAITETFENEYYRNSNGVEIARIYVKNGFYNEAMEVTETLCDAVGKTEIFVQITECHIKSEGMAEAVQYLKSSIKSVEAMDDSWEKDRMLKRITDILAETGDKELLLWLLEITKSTDDPEDRAEVMGRIAETYAKLGEMEEAPRIFSLALLEVKKIGGDFEMDEKCDALAEIGAGYHIAGLQLKEEDKAVLRALVLNAYPMESFWKTEGHKTVFRDLGFLISNLVLPASGRRATGPIIGGP